MRELRAPESAARIWARIFCAPPPDPAALKMHRIAELLFYCSMGNLKSIKRMARAPPSPAVWRLARNRCCVS